MYYKKKCATITIKNIPEELKENVFWSSAKHVINLSESQIQKNILHQLQVIYCSSCKVTFRANAGSIFIKEVSPFQYSDFAAPSYKKQNTRVFSGLPNGFPDIFGVYKDGKMFAIEVKKLSGRFTFEQIEMLRKLKGAGVYVGIINHFDKLPELIGFWERLYGNH